MELKMPDKKSVIYLIIAAIFALAVIFIIVYYVYFKAVPSETPLKPQMTEEELRVQRQLEELDRLREEAGSQPLTEEQITAQTKELDTLREQAKATPPTEEQIKSQMDELDRLREEAK